MVKARYVTVLKVREKMRIMVIRFEGCAPRTLYPGKTQLRCENVVRKSDHSNRMDVAIVARGSVFPRPDIICVLCVVFRWLRTRGLSILKLETKTLLKWRNVS